MKRIVFGNIKGGVGKTTMATAFIERWYPFRQVAGRDDDSQGSFGEALDFIQEVRGVRFSEQPDILLIDTRGELGSIQTDSADLIICPTGLSQVDINALAKFIGKCDDSQRARMAILPNKSKVTPARTLINQHQEAMDILHGFVESEGVLHVLPPVSQRELLQEFMQIFDENPFQTVPEKYRKRDQSFRNMIAELTAVIDVVEEMLELPKVAEEAA